MFLTLAHNKLDVYNISKLLVRHCYTIAGLMPDDERFNMAQQLKRAALSTQLNIAEGCSRKSETERKRFYEIARGSLIEIDIGCRRCIKLWKKSDLNELGEVMLRVFQMLSKMINTSHN